jgi:CubicO group peptidase (beta-lactamase class C family)
MTAGNAGIWRGRAWPYLACLALLALSILPGPRAASAEEVTGASPSAPVAATAGSEAISTLATILSEKYPSIRALVLVRGGCAIFEYYRSDIGAGTLSPVHSVTKSVLSVLVGIAIDQGFLRLDEKLSELLPETAEGNIDPRIPDITVRDLLTMSAGFDPAGGWSYASRISIPSSESWRWMLELPMKHPPGSQFNYDESDVNLLSVVLTRAIGQDAGRFAERNLFDPLDIADHPWAADADGYLVGGTSLFLTARDMAKIGLLYLQHGRWGEKQILSDAFVLDSTMKHNEGGPPIRAAYGYLWWVKKTKADQDSFFAAGSGSQLIYVVPKLDLVVALAAESIPGGSVSFVNDIVLPAAGASSGSSPCVARFAQGRVE